MIFPSSDSRQAGMMVGMYLPIKCGHRNRIHHLKTNPLMKSHVIADKELFNEAIEQVSGEDDDEKRDCGI